MGLVSWFLPEIEAPEAVAPAANVGHGSEEDESQSGWKPAPSDDEGRSESSEEEAEASSDSDSDGGHRDTADAKLHYVRDPYCAAKIRRMLRKDSWPTIYKRHGRGQISSSNANRIINSGWRIDVRPDPASDTGGSNLPLDVDAHRAPACCGVFDPWVNYPAHLPDTETCIFCGESNKVSSRGFASGAARCYGENESYPIVTRRIRHEGCKEAKPGAKTKTYTLLHERAIGRYSPLLRSILPVKVGSVFFEQSLVDNIVALKAEGLSIRAIERVLKNAYTTAHTRKWERYLLDVDERARRVTQQLPDNVGTPDEFGYWGGSGCRAPSRKKIRECYLQEMGRRRETMLKYICNLKGEVLCADHTFWAAKHVSDRHAKLFNALYAIMVRRYLPQLLLPNLTQVYFV